MYPRLRFSELRHFHSREATAGNSPGLQALSLPGLLAW